MKMYKFAKLLWYSQAETIRVSINAMGIMARKKMMKSKEGQIVWTMVQEYVIRMNAMMNFLVNFVMVK